MSETWTPSIHAGSGTIHERIVDAVRRDIASGDLGPDDRLPTHRELASRLGIGIGTVTRAYREAERLGLLTSTVGRGTFVSGHAVTEPVPNAPIDLTLNIQSVGDAPARIGAALARLQQRPDLAESVTVAPVPGIDWQRQVLSGWFARVTPHHRLDWRRSIVTTGAQHAMYLVLATHCRPGDTVLVEAATFSGIRAAAEALNLRCVGVAIDREGLVPEALEAAIVETGSPVLYTMPTLHNPTTSTMSAARRAAIADVIRAHDITVIEDEVYSPLVHEQMSRHPGLVSLAQLVPDQVCSIHSMSKAVAMGLRVGILEVPDARRFDLCCQALRATAYAASSISTLLACQLIKDGVADEIRRLATQEATHRMTLAQRMLGTAMVEPSFPSALQAWLPMSEVQAERIANGALRRGVTLTPPASFIVDPATGSGLRICLNSVSRPEIERALRLIRSALADELMPSRHAIV